MNISAKPSAAGRPDVVWTISERDADGLVGPPRWISRDEAEARAVAAALGARACEVRRVELTPALAG